MLTELSVRNARPREKAYKLSDSGSLYLFVTTSGHRSWRLNYRFADKLKTLVLGSYPEISLKAAREKRDEAKADLRKGRDPGTLKKLGVPKGGGARSFEMVARAWHERSKKKWRERHQFDVIRSLERDVFEFLGPMDVDNIDEPLLLSVLQRIENRGAVETAHRVRQRCESIFKAAKALGLTRNNPASDLGTLLQPFSKDRRWPALTEIGELRRLVAVLDSEAVMPATKLASRFLALTAQRPGTVAAARWDEIEGFDPAYPHRDRSSAYWVIPADKMKKITNQAKAGREHRVPLATQAVDVLVAAHSISAGGPYIFPSGRSFREPMSSNALNVFYKRAGFKGIQVPHGWRASFSTVMNARLERAHPGSERMLIERLIIDLMLAHAPSGLSANELDYNRAAYMERRREIAQSWADLVLEGAVDASELLDGPRRRLD